MSKLVTAKRKMKSNVRLVRKVAIICSEHNMRGIFLSISINLRM